jgi:hypothetical protein
MRTNETNEEIMYLMKRFVAAIDADSKSDKLCDSTFVHLILMELIRYDGTKSEIFIGKSVELYRFFKRNKALFFQLSQFIDFQNSSSNCATCGKASWVHHKGPARNPYAGMDGMNACKSYKREPLGIL